MVGPVDLREAKGQRNSGSRGKEKNRLGAQDLIAQFPAVPSPSLLALVLRAFIFITYQLSWLAKSGRILFLGGIGEYFHPNISSAPPSTVYRGRIVI